MSRRLPRIAIFVRYSGWAAPTPPSARDQASLRRGARLTVRDDADARDCRSGLLPQVVQPGPPVAGAAASADAGRESARAASANRPAARVRAVITRRPATAATIAWRPDRGGAAR